MSSKLFLPAENISIYVDDMTSTSCYNPYVVRKQLSTLKILTFQLREF